jgi:hypothetical protein
MDFCGQNLDRTCHFGFDGLVGGEPRTWEANGKCGTVVQTVTECRQSPFMKLDQAFHESEPESDSAAAPFDAAIRLHEWLEGARQGLCVHTNPGVPYG